jgi:hypothetical protein
MYAEELQEKPDGDSLLGLPLRKCEDGWDYTLKEKPMSDLCKQCNQPLPEGANTLRCQACLVAAIRADIPVSENK